ncbi:hypothetical protein WJ24_03830 [Burkholderia vietnamiensis]|nr:hypothetical protein WJ24_03830 [Burkholderia vietnamiensis]
MALAPASIFNKTPPTPHIFAALDDFDVDANAGSEIVIPFVMFPPGNRFLAASFVMPRYSVVPGERRLFSIAESIRETLGSLLFPDRKSLLIRRKSSPEYDDRADFSFGVSFADSDGAGRAWLVRLAAAALFPIEDTFCPLNFPPAPALISPFLPMRM